MHKGIAHVWFGREPDAGGVPPFELGLADSGLRDGKNINFTNENIVGEVYRFYNEKTGVHFLTTSSDERDVIINAMPTFRYEGVAFSTTATPVDGIAIYRFFNRDTGAHFYTSSEIERDNVMADLPSFTYEGVAFYAHGGGSADRQAVYRFYNNETGTHFYTASDSERDNVQTSLPSFVRLR